ncbi:hypothetical protein G9A89_013299 [Geosiphon pyriformis]|nr:hypothetical protein G9A89_013299 [Geosiphon pyriformis]
MIRKSISNPDCRFQIPNNPPNSETYHQNYLSMMTTNQHQIESGKKIKEETKRKRKKKTPSKLTTHIFQPLTLHHNSAYYGNNEEYTSATKFYCCPYIIKHFRRPKQVGKWDNEPCLACGETFLDKGM